MNNFVNVLEKKVVPVANKLGQQRHMAAIRKGIISTLPLTIVGSFFTILSNMPIPAVAHFLAPYQEILDIPFRFTVGILSLYATFGISYSLAQYYKLDPLTNGIIGVMAFLVATAKPLHVLKPQGMVEAGRYLNIANLSASSLFAAIVTALVSVEIVHYFTKHNITIKMPAGVPPEVANSFAGLFPAAVVLILFWLVRHLLGFNIATFLSSLLMPLKGVLAGNSLGGGILTILFITIFWTLGIHGTAIMDPIIRPFWEMAIAKNMTEFQAGTNVHHLSTIFTEQFLQWFVWIGGAGGTLALVILFLFSKSNYLKELGRLALLPGLFNINEPVMFGAPIVLNPILAIPFIIAPIVTAVIAYFATISGLVPMMMARLPFSFPAPIAALMSTNWSWQALVLSLVNFMVDLVIYYPFFKVFEYQQLQRETTTNN
ncbi:PTS sugar transporter subunit IIC [Bombilactobacillus mellis]|uniref:PTS sugar transporter subunit IIC n=1 Tax=Bombilactobacillus mellis TaxID=1218508 RepID=UPI00224606DA|nr:PTS sugar transporter subunit IIC [Bombilactobacillus mellis]MCX0278706.1 PTS sugar transporter subunit IIC [Bombilactobacillus mellis]